MSFVRTYFILMFIVCYLVQADSLGNELCYSIGFKVDVLFLYTT